CRHAAGNDKALAIEKARRVADVGLDADHLANPKRIDADAQVLLARCDADCECRSAAICQSHEGLQLPLRRRPRGNKQEQAEHQQPDATAWAQDDYRAKIPRNTRANGDTVTSPELNAKGFTRPSLFATMMSVIPFDGMLTSMDDDAFSLTPNCQ